MLAMDMADKMSPTLCHQHDRHQCDDRDTDGDKNLKHFIKNNGFDPHFETTFKIGQIGIPEVSFLKIRVFDEDGPLDKDDFGEFPYRMTKLFYI